MKFLFLLAVAALLHACQQETTNEATPQNDMIAHEAIKSMEQALHTITLGETTTDGLATYTKLSDTTYESPPVTVTVKHGLVDSITVTASEALSAQQVAHIDLTMFDGYNAQWLLGENSALQLTLTEPTRQQQIAAMPLDERVGQLVLTGFDGTTVTPIIKKAIEEAHIGHVILFSKNIETPQQLQALNTSLFALDPALWITVDEEGGNVSRIPNGLTVLPTAARLTNYTPEQVEQLARMQGELLRALGFTVNFAPVLDVNSNPQNPVIGSRAFSADVETVETYAMAFANGLKQAGVVAGGKHFPGHGDTKTDSHVALPIINKTKDALLKTELAPFQHAINHGVEMLMIGHLLVPALDAEHPTSSSRAVMHDLLREEMGFNGVIITDDLTMQAVDAPVVDAAVESIIAGADIALIGHGTEIAIAATDALEAAVVAGRLTEQQLNERVHRILSLKEKYNGAVNTNLDFNGWNKEMNAQLQ